MTGLLRSELLRLRSRRVVLLIGIVAGVVLVLILVSLAVNSSREGPSPQTLAEAQRALEDTIRFCREDPTAACPPGFVEDLRLEDFYEDPRFALGRGSEAPVVGFALFLSIAAFMLGATFIGSDLHHNSLGNLLLWEPRRGRVLLTKAAVVGAATGAGAFVLQLLLLGGMWLVAATRGVTSAPPGFLGDVVGDMARGSIVVTFGSLLGFALTSLTRSTAAGLGLGLVYLAALERFLGAVRPAWRPWMIGDLAAALFVGETRIIVPLGNGVQTITEHGVLIGYREIVITAGRAGVVLGIYLAVMFGLSVLEFRRRDVT